MKEEKDMFIMFEGGAYYDNALWCMRTKENALYRIDTNTGEVEFVIAFDRLDGNLLQIVKIIEYNGKLILIPGYSKYIITYDINKKEENYYEYPCFEEADFFGKFGAFLKKENCLFLLPITMKYTLIINLDNMHFEYLYDTVECFEKVYGKKEKFICGFMGDCKGKDIYVPCCLQNAVVHLDSNNYRSDLIQIEDGDFEGKGFKDLVAYENYLILLDIKGNLISWDLNLKKSKIIFNNDERNFSCLEGNKKEIWLIPGDSKEIGVYDVEKESVNFLEYPAGHKFQETFLNIDRLTFNDKNRIGNIVYLTPRSSNMILALNLKEKSVKGIKLCAGTKFQSFLVEDLKKQMYTKQIVNEADFGLDIFLEHIKKDVRTISDNYNIGQAIYKFIKSEM